MPASFFWLTLRQAAVLLLGMTSSKLVSVKVPLKIFRAIPGAHRGRSRFIISALEEKISRGHPPEWKPMTARGRQLAALLEKGKTERGELLDDEGIARELRERRGGLH